MRLRRIIPLFLGAAACAADAPDPACPSVHLAFDGATLDAVGEGKDDAVSGQSSLIDGPVTYPPFLAGRADRDAVIAQITDDVARALDPVGVDVTTRRPDGDHVLVVFAGVDQGVLFGLTQQDCGDQIANDVMIRFEGVVAPEYGRYSAANEVMLGLSLAVGLGKSYSDDSHPCSCDPSNCGNDTLCELTSAAEVTFAPCTRVGDIQDEIDAFERSFACER